jgi:hypothetical protein
MTYLSDQYQPPAACTGGSCDLPERIACKPADGGTGGLRAGDAAASSVKCRTDETDCCFGVLRKPRNGDVGIDDHELVSIAAVR